ncbi:pyridoxal phosphate-dependent transferase [Apiosordaria backusii]|uniref:Pyridoxal phosphate-dependent transferase n=1 Tax=Apiosordaria backusii TaxID=314023 RepID=A0AA40EBC7_9PEZI|nr:pyridoxal phosphate-dependent transferase [Apiosordaria backusii]
MARPSILLRFSERRHRRGSSLNGHTKSADISAPVTTPVTREKSWKHRSLGSITSIFHGDHPVPQNVYEKPVELIRKEEYPHMNNKTYLDHSGTTIYAASTITRFSHKMLHNLYGNPHSENEPAKVSGDMVDAIRLKALRFLGADPEHFDLVFTANATAAIKLVADSFRDLAEQTRSGSFWYGYHRDAHTSLVGVRELVRDNEHHCFAHDAEVEAWLSNPEGYHREIDRVSSLGLFAWPGQSNLTGRRLPLEWAGRVRKTRHLQGTYTLLDAAALAMTSDMSRVFGDVENAPDFACVSFYKIFGFPDLGGLVVRKDSGHILTLRKYFGGGTISMVKTVGSGPAWHISKGSEGAVENGEAASGGLHEALEDGTLPFHSILALGEAIEVHRELYGNMENISRHTTGLAVRLYNGMRALRYGNGMPVCKIYEEDGEGGYGDEKRQGGTVAFNVFGEDGRVVSYDRVEGLANERGIYVRSGGICCPGGVYTVLQYEPWQLNRAKSAGHRCGRFAFSRNKAAWEDSANMLFHTGHQGLGVINDLPTGVVRASLGAMSTTKDVDTFIEFLRETFVAPAARPRKNSSSSSSSGNSSTSLTAEQNPGPVETFEVRAPPRVAPGCCSLS